MCESSKLWNLAKYIKASRNIKVFIKMYKLYLQTLSLMRASFKLVGIFFILLF